MTAGRVRHDVLPAGVPAGCRAAEPAISSQFRCLFRMYFFVQSVRRRLYTESMKTAAVAGRKPGLRAFEESVELPFPEKASRLREILGVRLVAYIGGVKSTRVVSGWVAGTSRPGETERDRLQHAFHAAALLRERYDQATVQSWFKGLNPQLGDKAPARVLAEGDPAAVAGDVLAAAKSFASVG